MHQGSFFGFFIVFLTSTLVLAAEGTTPNNSTQELPLPTIMHNFNSTLQDLKPYVLDIKKFSDPKNKPIVQKLLQDLSEKSSQSKSKELDASVGFNQTYDLLAHHLRSTKYYYERDIFAKSHQMLKKTFGLCIACHERLPKTAIYSPDAALLASIKKFDLTEADYYHTAHQFEKSLAIYNHIIKKFDSKSSTEELNSALERKLSFFVRINQDNEAAAKSFKEDLTNVALLKDTKSTIEFWVKQFSAPKKLPKSEDLISESEKLIKTLGDGQKILLSNEYLIQLLQYSGELYKLAFNTRDFSTKAKLLFLLAQFEKKLVSVRGFSLADIYLYECVMNYTKTDTAEKCFKEYESIMSQKTFSSEKGLIDSTISIMRKKLNEK